MKRYTYLSLIVLLCITFISWGFKGHKAVATIAENHLNNNVKEVVKMMLDNHSMAEVASWADEIRNDPKYRFTSSWHFLNLPLGLSRSEFEQKIKSQQDVNNIYAAIMWCELKLNSIPKSQDDANKQQEALKFLIHLVGDAHQPMHISRAEDKGGNTIQVRFDDGGTNLHSLWDSKLIDHECLSDEQIVKEYDTATPDQIKKWQGDDPLVWLWESYQISSKLYDEVEGSNKLGEDYFRSHINMVHERIDKAGIRLAGILNETFRGASEKVVITHVTLTPPPPSTHLFGEKVAKVSLDDLRHHIGATIRVSGKVYSNKAVGNMLLLDMGASHPNQKLTIVLKSTAQEFFKAFVEQNGQGKTVSEYLKDRTLHAIGKVVLYKGKPEIVITDSTAFILEPW